MLVTVAKPFKEALEDGYNGMTSDLDTTIAVPIQEHAAPGE